MPKETPIPRTTVSLYTPDTIHYRFRVESAELVAAPCDMSVGSDENEVLLVERGHRRIIDARDMERETAQSPCVL